MSTTIVHISALFYQSLSIISASGRKLLKMKNGTYPVWVYLEGNNAVSIRKGLI